MTSEAKEPVLKPASDNPWYVLATVCGEHTGGEIDWDLHARNRRIWNGWACLRLSPEERDELAKRLGIDVGDLHSLDQEELERIDSAFKERMGSKRRNPFGGVYPPYVGPNMNIDFSNTEFFPKEGEKGYRVCFEGFVFPGKADFTNSVFSHDVEFRRAEFLERAGFHNSRFEGEAKFTGARFRSDASFSATSFSKADYTNVLFNSYALFDSAKFESKACFSGASFNHLALFENAEIAGADFSHAVFFLRDSDYCADGSFDKNGKAASFRGSSFHGQANFFSAEFGAGANFGGVAFNSPVDFSSTKFISKCMKIDFIGSDFHGVSFSSAEFNCVVEFFSCTFHGKVDFTKVIFNCPVRFETARFVGYENQPMMGHENLESGVPAFYDATFRQDTRFPLAYSHWPGITRENATDAKEAYAALRLAMEDLKKVEDAQFFARQELRCKARSEDWFTGRLLAAYGVFSDFGHSVGRPLLWLVGFGILFAFAYAAAFLPSGLISGEQTYGAAVQSCLAGDGCMPFCRGLGLSAVSSSPFLGGKVLYFGRALVEGPIWLGVLTGIQTTIAIVLLFLFGLALRNRFRLR